MQTNYRCPLRLALFAIVWLVGLPAFADDEVAASAEKQPVAERPAEQATAEEPPSSLHALFYSALRQLYGSAPAAAEEAFAKVVKERNAEGYENLPRYSETLLDFAVAHHAKATNESDLAAQAAVSAALQLSPFDARVHARVASLTGIVGTSGMLEHGLRALELSLRFPSLIFAAGLNAFLLSLIALTSALLVVIVIQFARHSEAAIIAVNKSLPRLGFIGSAAAIALFLALALWSGILGAALAGCSLLVAISRSARGLLTLCGALFVGWGCGLVIISVCGGNVSAGIVRAIEDSAQRSYSPEDAVIINAAVHEEPGSALRLFTAARVLERRGDLQRAERHYALARKNSADASLSIAAENNMGVLAYRRKDFPAAREHLLAAEQLGGASPELFLNLSRVHSALLDLDGHRNYFEKLKAEFPEYAKSTAEELPLDPSSSEAVVSVEVPAWMLYRELLRPNEKTKTTRDEARANLSHALLRGSNPFVLAILGVGLTLFGLLSLGAGKRLRWVNKEVHLGLASRVWRVLPFGGVAAGEHPAVAVIGMGAILFFVMLAVEQPVRLYPVTPTEIPMTLFWLTVALLVSFCSLAPSLIHARRKAAFAGDLS